jgi:hypothetical protein
MTAVYRNHPRLDIPEGGFYEGIKLEQVFLDHPSHQIAGVDRVDTVTELALEAVPVEQCHEQLEVLLLPIVRRRREKQKVSCKCGEKLTELVALGPDPVRAVRVCHALLSPRWIAPTINQAQRMSAEIEEPRQSVKHPAR